MFDGEEASPGTTGNVTVTPPLHSVIVTLRFLGFTLGFEDTCFLKDSCNEVVTMVF